MTEDEIINFRVSPAVKKQLERIEQETGKNESEICREAIIAYIGMYDKTKSEHEADHAGE